MIGLELYKTYQAYNLHFNDNVKYDCVTYNFKTRVNEESFKKSKFRWQFTGMEKKLNDKPLRFILFNAYELHGFTYITPQKVIQTISRHSDINQQTFLQTTFKKDVQYLRSVYNGSTNLFMTNDLYPNIYHEYLNGKINIKSLMILDVFIKDVINSKTSRDIIAWPTYVKQADKLKGLIGYFFNRQQIEQLFTDIYLQPSRLD